MRAAARRIDRVLEAFGLAWHHVPVPDQAAPTMEQLIATGAWLRKRHDEDAIEMVRSARPEIRINPEQLAWLRDVEARLAGDRKRSG